MRSLLFLILFSPIVQAQSLVVTMATLPDRVRRHNPDLIAAKSLISEAVGLQLQAGRLANPELALELAHTPDLSERSFKVGLRQKFPTTNRLSLEKSITTLHVRAAEAEVRDVARVITGQARTALVKVLALRAKKQLIERQITLSNELSETLEQFQIEGSASPLDASQARLATLQLKTKMASIAVEELAAINALKPLLGISTTQAITVSGELASPTSAAAGTGIFRRPDIAAAGLSEKAAAEDIALQESLKYSDIEASIFAEITREEDAPEGFDREGFIGVGFTIALPYHDKNEGNISAAIARRDRAKAERDALVKKAQLSIAGAKQEMLEWAKLERQISDNLLPAAAQQADESQAAYNDGLLDFKSVLNARRQSLELQSTRLTAIEHYHLARVTYLTARGL